MSSPNSGSESNRSSGDAWFVRGGGKQFGPFSLKRLREFVEQGKLKPTTEASSDARTWVPASQVPGLFTSASTTKDPEREPTPVLAPPPVLPASDSGLIGLGTVPPRPMFRITTPQILIVCVTIFATVLVWRMLSQAMPPSTNYSVTGSARVRSDEPNRAGPPPVTRSPTTVDLSWTTAFPNRMPAESLRMFGFGPSVPLDATDAVWFTPVGEKKRGPHKDCLVEDSAIPRVVGGGTVLLGEIPVGSSAPTEELYRALATSSAVISYVAGFDMEVEQNVHIDSGGNRGPRFSIRTRSLMITSVAASGELDRQALLPFVGKLFKTNTYR